MPNPIVTPVRHVPDAERRARIARRHGLATAHRFTTVAAAADAMIGLHGTDPVGIRTSALARVARIVPADVDHALHHERSLVDHLAMRRTLFVLPRRRLAVVTAAAGPRVTHTIRRDLVRDVRRCGLQSDPDAWLDALAPAVLAALESDVLTLDELRERVPPLRGTTTQGTGRVWDRPLAVAPRVLAWLCAQGAVVRAGNDGHWRTSRHRWASMAGWLGAPIPALDPERAGTDLIRWWLHVFGPGTEDDLRWWLGATLTQVRAALRALDAAPVTLDGGGLGHLLPDDLDPVDPVEPWAALLGVLDPTVMGWRERHWYLGVHRDEVTDSVGNVGPTAWWDGRVVGRWHQDDAGRVRLELFDDPGPTARQALAEQAARVAEFCGGDAVVPRYP